MCVWLLTRIEIVFVANEVFGVLFFSFSLSFLLSWGYREKEGGLEESHVREFHLSVCVRACVRARAIRTAAVGNEGERS